MSGKNPQKVLNLSVDLPRKKQGGRLAQLGERGVRNAEVVGSSPIPSTIFFFRNKCHE